MVSLTSLLNLYCEQAKWSELTLFYQQIRRQGFQPNSFTFSTLLKFSSSSSSSLDYEGQSIHADATKHGFVDSDNYVINSLISMYSQCGSLSNALKVFDEMLLPQPVNFNTIISSCFQAGDCTKASKLFERMREFHIPNEITWSAMISGYSQNNQFEDAQSFFKKMTRESCVSPNSHTITSVLSACGQMRDIGFGEQVHGYTIKMSNYVENDVFVGTSLIDLYGKCGYQELAELVFDSSIDKCVVSWSVLIATYVRNNCPSRAIEAFRKMVYNRLEPNVVTLSTLTTACSDLPNLILGKELHGFIVRRKAVRLDVFVSTSLIDMYSKCHCMFYAHRIFEKDCKNLSGLVTTTMWNAMIAGFVENNCFDDAWKLFRSMNLGSTADLKPNTVTMAIILPLCTKVSSLLYGKEVHCYAVKNGLDDEMLVGNNLLDMYAKCGKLHMAESQFNKMLQRNSISWTSMINGYAVHGDGDGAIRFFQRMVTETDIKPDHVAFVALISACSHAGQVEDGLRYFESMSKDYSLTPKQENYGAVVDLLARAGRIDEAKKLIAMMPMKPGANVWGALLGACRIHGYVKEAENAAENLLKLEPKEGGFRKLLSSLYSEMGRLDRVAEVRSAMREMNVIKRQGFSWLETNEGIHGFVAGEIKLH